MAVEEQELRVFEALGQRSEPTAVVLVVCATFAQHHLEDSYSAAAAVPAPLLSELPRHERPELPTHAQARPVLERPPDHRHGLLLARPSHYQESMNRATKTTMMAAVT
jgi:hypothetical protein